MKICILGNGILAREFAKLGYDVYLDFDPEALSIYDIVINTKNYRYGHDDFDSFDKLMECNVYEPQLISEFCDANKKRYVHISDANLYGKRMDECHEVDTISAKDAYLASKLLGEASCSRKNLIIRTKNIFNDEANSDNALFNAIINSTPSKNLESYTYALDIIRTIIGLLKHKKHGIFNIASNGYISQAEICKLCDIKNIAPTLDHNIWHIKMNIDKVKEHIIPMDIEENIIPCFIGIVEELGEQI